MEINNSTLDKQEVMRIDMLNYGDVVEYAILICEKTTIFDEVHDRGYRVYVFSNHLSCSLDKETTKDYSYETFDEANSEMDKWVEEANECFGKYDDFFE